MNVRLTPLDHPERTLLYGGVKRMLVRNDTVVLTPLDAREPALTLTVGVGWLRAGMPVIDCDNETGDYW